MPAIASELIQPLNQSPQATYQAVVRLKITFQEDFVYSPVSLSVNGEGTKTKIESVNIESIGDCIRDVVAPGIRFNSQRLVDGLIMVYFSFSFVKEKMKTELEFSFIKF